MSSPVRFRASWFETRGVATLLTMRVYLRRLVFDLILRSALSRASRRMGHATTRTHTSAFPRHENVRVMHRPRALEKKRAQGMPGAGRTREPCVQRKCTLRTQATTGEPGHPALPAQWCYGLYVLSSVHRACWPPSRCPRLAALDPSVGGPGRHDFAVRLDPARRASQSVHRIPCQRS
jgi:hypothetical protein